MGRGADLIIRELDANGNTTTTYIYDDYGTPVKVIKGGKSYFFHYNAQGDVVALTLGSSDFYLLDGPQPGDVVASYKYDDWGNLLESTGTIETPFGYRGKFGYIYDKETGLYFLKTRYYDPETGRFTTKDRFKGFENRPASQNQYTYCEGDPVNAVDPNGMYVHAIVAVGAYILVAYGVLAYYSWLNNPRTQAAIAGLQAIIERKVRSSLNWLHSESKHHVGGYDVTIARHFGKKHAHWQKGNERGSCNFNGGPHHGKKKPKIPKKVREFLKRKGFNV